MLLCISNAGSEGKSTIAKAIKEAMLNHGTKHSTYLCDKDHIELLKTYGSQVKLFDIRKDKETLINSLADEVDFILVDFPAASIDELDNVFGSMQEFVSALEAFEVSPVFIVPVVSDKSLQSIDRLGELLSEVTGEYEYVYVLNQGLMTNKDTITEAFNSNKTALKALDDAIGKVVTITTKFTPAFAELVKTQMLRQTLTNNTGLKPMEKVLLIDFLKKTDDQFQKVFSL